MVHLMNLVHAPMKKEGFIWVVLLNHARTFQANVRVLLICAARQIFYGQFTENSNVNRLQLGVFFHSYDAKHTPITLTYQSHLRVCVFFVYWSLIIGLGQSCDMFDGTMPTHTRQAVLLLLLVLIQVRNISKNSPTYPCVGVIHCRISEILLYTRH